MKYFLIVRKMKIINYILFCIGITLFLTGCQSVKDGLTGNKKNNNDEFLVQKKNPLTMPPDYGVLPEPKNKNVEKNQEDIESLISGEFTKENKEKLSKNSNGNIESKILEKINAK
jgi:PBP1b-binding outer membrane lipoprotein LpoB